MLNNIELCAQRIEGTQLCPCLRGKQNVIGISEDSQEEGIALPASLRFFHETVSKFFDNSLSLNYMAKHSPKREEGQ